jgi:hypothetical protein
MEIFINVNKEGALIKADDIPLGKNTDSHKMTYSSSTNQRARSIAEVVARIKVLLKNSLPEN